VNGPKQQDKPFQISKWKVWEAFERVKANKGAAGVDEQSISEFEADRDRNLYKIWNRMSSGSYFPPPVKAVEIPKAGGKGVRLLGVPTVADRVAQTVARLYLEPQVEPVFHLDSYGYRPGKSALDAVAACRKRCWRADWVIDMDIRAFLDASSHCSFCWLWWSEQPVLRGWWFDTQAFPASGADVDGAEPPVLDTLHDGLAGDAVGEGGFQHG
jgi:RNA-directed DNA polymerase